MHHDQGGGHASAQAAAAGGPDQFSGDLSGTVYEQEVQTLRGQVGDLNFGRTWQAANPPKSSATYGIALQSVEVGNNLRLAGRVFTGRLARAAQTTARIVTLVRTYKPPTYGAKK